MAKKVVAEESGDKEGVIMNEALIRSVDSYVISINTPKIFSNESEDNVLRGMDLSFENLCASMEEAGINNPKGLSVFEFNSKLDYFESKKPK